MGPALLLRSCTRVLGKRIFQLSILGGFNWEVNLEAEFLVVFQLYLLPPIRSWPIIGNLARNCKERKKFGFSNEIEQAQLFKYAEELNSFDPNQHELIDWRGDVSKIHKASES